MGIFQCFKTMQIRIAFNLDHRQIFAIRFKTVQIRIAFNRTLPSMTNAYRFKTVQIRIAFNPQTVNLTGIT